MPALFVYYSNVINAILILALLFVIKYFHGKKCLTVFAAVFILSFGLFISSINGTFSSYAEKLMNETPEAKVAAYIQAVSSEDKQSALNLWKVYSGSKDLEKRKEGITEELISEKISSKFTITNIEWWSMCCASVERVSREKACFARVYAQFPDKNGLSLNYVFDVETKGGCQWMYSSGIFPYRHWEIRDIYSQGQEPIFETMLK